MIIENLSKSNKIEYLEVGPLKYNHQNKISTKFYKTKVRLKKEIFFLFIKKELIDREQIRKILAKKFAWKH